MFAIVKIAGQQFRVQEGQSLFVPHLPGQTGDAIEFSDVLYVDRNGVITAGAEAKATVKATIINDMVKADTVIAFKMKRRKGFRKKKGHRTQHTQLKIESIS
jgi:large subunit ribosomal protein L21